MTPHSTTKETPLKMVYGKGDMSSVEIDTPICHCEHSNEEGKTRSKVTCISHSNVVSNNYYAKLIEFVHMKKMKKG